VKVKHLTKDLAAPTARKPWPLAERDATSD
jgi:hypothetical protein